MPRPRNVERSVTWKAQIPETLAGRVELLLMDPARGRPIYGARSDLIARLLTEWVESNPRPLIAERT